MVSYLLEGLDLIRSLEAEYCAQISRFVPILRLHMHSRGYYYLVSHDSGQQVPMPDRVTFSRRSHMSAPFASFAAIASSPELARYLH